MSYYITHSGEHIDLDRFSTKNVNLPDIAHHLTKICRYGGALDLNTHYSVANHSMMLYFYCVHNRLSLDVQRAVLMHDAAEAYLGDVVSGLKVRLPDYQLIESEIEHVIHQKYKLNNSIEVCKIVKDLDTRIVLDEALQFHTKSYRCFASQIGYNTAPLGIVIRPDRSLKFTKNMFLKCCQVLRIHD